MFDGTWLVSSPFQVTCSPRFGPGTFPFCEPTTAVAVRYDLPWAVLAEKNRVQVFDFKIIYHQHPAASGRKFQKQ
jgi:hypothetical protein